MPKTNFTVVSGNFRAKIRVLCFWGLLTVISHFSKNCLLESRGYCENTYTPMPTRPDSWHVFSGLQLWLNWSVWLFRTNQDFEFLAACVQQNLHAHIQSSFKRKVAGGFVSGSFRARFGFFLGGGKRTRPIFSVLGKMRALLLFSVQTAQASKSVLFCTTSCRVAPSDRDVYKISAKLATSHWALRSC